jgi:quinol monooxygenase YgiN
MVMPTATIGVHTEIVTLVTTYHTRPGSQPEVLQNLKQFVRKHLSFQAGFVSSSLHVSQDGARILNYCQWSSILDFQKTISNPDIQPFLHQLATLARNETTVYLVDSVEHIDEEADFDQINHFMYPGEMGISREI